MFYYYYIIMTHARDQCQSFSFIPDLTRRKIYATLVSNMKKRRVHRGSKAVKARYVSQKPSENYLVVVRSWMLVVLFALMLGIGAVVGNYLNQKLSETPQVAGSQIELR